MKFVSERYSDSKAHPICRLILLSTIKIIICTLPFPDPNLTYTSNDGTRSTPKKTVFVYREAVLIIVNTEKPKHTELTSFSAGDDTVIIT